MREINIDGTKIRVRATPLTLLYYKQAFGADMIGSLMKLKDLMDDPEKFDSLSILQMLWAMAKTDQGPGKSFPSFEAWLAELGEIDFTDADMLQDILNEAMDGFFRRGTAGSE